MRGVTDAQIISAGKKFKSFKLYTSLKMRAILFLLDPLYGRFHCTTTLRLPGCRNTAIKLSVRARYFKFSQDVHHPIDEKDWFLGTPFMRGVTDAQRHWGSRGVEIRLSKFKCGQDISNFLQDVHHPIDEKDWFLGTPFMRGVTDAQRHWNSRGVEIWLSKYKFGQDILDHLKMVSSRKMRTIGLEVPFLRGVTDAQRVRGPVGFRV
jgi:hypothetical protein